MNKHILISHILRPAYVSRENKIIQTCPPNNQTKIRPSSESIKTPPLSPWTSDGLHCLWQDSLSKRKALPHQSFRRKKPVSGFVSTFSRGKNMWSFPKMRFRNCQVFKRPWRCEILCFAAWRLWSRLKVSFLWNFTNSYEFLVLAWVWHRLTGVTHNALTASTYIILFIHLYPWESWELLGPSLLALRVPSCPSIRSE